MSDGGKKTFIFNMLPDDTGCAAPILAIAVLLYVLGNGCTPSDVISTPPTGVDRWAPDSVLGRLHSLEAEVERLNQSRDEN